MQLGPEDAARLANDLLDLKTQEGPSSEDGLAGLNAQMHSLPGGRLGNYRIVRLVGSGGMGDVYEAEQENPRRRVALKVVRASLMRDDLRRRFEHEVRILGRLQHPGIAQIYEAGQLSAAGDGAGGATPYFAMEYVEGEPLTAYAAGRALGIREKLELFLRVCQAVEHAHQRGIIHRDLKPENILVTVLRGGAAGPESALRDAIGQPKVLDFGVARATDADVTITSMYTEIGKLVGTIPYMSPEQASGDSSELDTRSDVYALGVVLYELLSGKLPYEVKGDGKGRVAQALHVIKEVDPAPLSSVDRVFRGDLETIVGKALEKERGRRYQSVGELAGDIRRHLDDEPIVARRASGWYELRKFARRNRSLVAGASVVAALLVVCLTGAIVFGVREVRHARELATAKTAVENSLEEVTEKEQQAKQSADIATGVIDFVTGALSEIQPNKSGPNATLLDLLEAATLELKTKAPSDAAVAASIKATVGVMYLSLQKNEVAAEMLKEALREQEAVLGAESHTTLKTLHSLCKALRNTNRAPETREFTSIMQERGLRVYGDHSQYVLAARNILISCLETEGKVEEAKREAQAALADSIVHNGEASEISLVLLGTLAQLTQMTGDVNETERLWEKYLQLDGGRAVLGEMDLVVTKAQLAQVYWAKGHADRAEPLLQEALRGQRVRQGPDHPSCLKTQLSLANVLKDLHRISEAEAMFREAVQLSRDSHGPKDRQTLMAIGILGEMLASEQRFEEAESLLREALAGFKEIDSEMSYNVSAMQGNLADLLSVQGRSEEAERLSREVAEAAEKKHGAKSPATMRMKNNLAAILGRAEKFEEAEGIYRFSIETLLALRDPPKVGVVVTYLNMGSCQVKQKKFEDAERSLREAYEVGIAHFPEGHHTPLLAAQELSDMYELWGRPEQSDEWAIKAKQTPRSRP